ncbi:hypothetical protein BJ741DRAFT_617463 [Chytriomyces cf. hyalinus JEL632]|nr:hypothetical protein BJ741DRAFT_617463 [Chytriomyces cf. hyalinus JEL632]
MVLGNFIGGTVTLILQALFVFSMVGCIYSLKAYALACRGISFLCATQHVQYKNGGINCDCSFSTSRVGVPIKRGLPNSWVCV